MFGFADIGLGPRGAQLENLLQCPGCDLLLPEDDLAAQMDHMTRFHGEIVAGRQAEADRWAGWEND
jgi:hypothetical protein